jgi:hypothetical protein
MGLLRERGDACIVPLKRGYKNGLPKEAVDLVERNRMDQIA